MHYSIFFHSPSYFFLCYLFNAFDTMALMPFILFFGAFSDFEIKFRVFYLNFRLFMLMQYFSFFLIQCTMLHIILQVFILSYIADSNFCLTYSFTATINRIFDKLMMSMKVNILNRIIFRTNYC